MIHLLARPDVLICLRGDDTRAGFDAARSGPARAMGRLVMGVVSVAVSFVTPVANLPCMTRTAVRDRWIREVVLPATRGSGGVLARARPRHDLFRDAERTATTRRFASDTRSRGGADGAPSATLAI